MVRDAWDVAEEILGYPGAMLSGTKTAPPGETVVWNSNVSAGAEKIWYGDINLDKSAGKLQNLADILGETIYVLSEMDARFDTEKNPRTDRARATFSPFAHEWIYSDYRAQNRVTIPHKFCSICAGCHSSVDCPALNSPELV
jgi:hypothetical protein